MNKLIIDGIKICEANRFSTFVKSHEELGYQELNQWVDWFALRGIKAVIHATSSGLAVYRLGLIHVPVEKKSTKKYKSQRIPIFTTPLQSQIIKSMATGSNNQEIAKSLNIKIHTIHKLQSFMRKRLNLSSNQELIRYWQKSTATPQT